MEFGDLSDAREGSGVVYAREVRCCLRSQWRISDSSWSDGRDQCWRGLNMWMALEEDLCFTVTLGLGVNTGILHVYGPKLKVITHMFASRTI